jgi:hypothetical protein
MPESIRPTQQKFKIRPQRTGWISLGALPNFSSQSTRTFADHGAARRQRLDPHPWALLDRADHRSVFHAIGVSHGHEALLGAQAVNQALLCAAKDSVRKDGKMPEHPKEINALTKGRHQVPWSKRCLHLNHAVRQFLNPHNQARLNTQVWPEQFQGRNYCTKVGAMGRAFTQILEYFAFVGG